MVRKYSMNLKASRAVYVAFVVLAAAWALLSECGEVPTNYMSPAPRAIYYLDLLSVVWTLGGTYAALRFFTFKRVARSLREAAAVEAWQRYVAGTLCRSVLLGMAFWYNVIYYYASDYTTTPGYCLLICLVGMMFCWPSSGEFERLRVRKV